MVDARWIGSRSTYHMLKQAKGRLIYHIHSTISLRPYESSNAVIGVDLIGGVRGGASLRRLVQGFDVYFFDVNGPIMISVCIAWINLKKFADAAKHQ